MSPKRHDDPDPFAETLLAVDERREMLEKLSAYMKPIVQPATEESRARLRVMWDDLREQETVESFKAQAELLLAALRDLSGDEMPDDSRNDEVNSRRKPPPKKLGGFLEPATGSTTLGDWDRPVLGDLPPASFPNQAPPP